MSISNKKDKAVLMTEGSIPKLMVSFALPVFWGNLFQQLYNVVDSLIVGNFVGDDALAAVSSSGNLIFVLTGFLFGVFSGSGVVIAKYFGARDKNNVQRAIHTSIALALVCGVMMMLMGIFLSPTILRWMNTPEQVLPNSVAYFRIFFLGAIFTALYNSGAGVFQAVGDSKHPLYYLIVSSVTNVVLDLLFVGVFKFGIQGAATATVLSQFVSCVLMINKLMHSEETYQLHLNRIRLHRDMLSQILKVGIPSGIQNSVIGFANAIVQTNINAFGDVAMAGCGSYSKLEGFAFLPVNSFAMALTTFIGQNTGAKEFERAKKGARFGAISCAVCSEIIGLIMFICIPVFIRAFSQNPEVIQYGTMQARVVSLFYFLMAFSHASAGIMRGVGKSVVPMAVMLIYWCVVRVAYISIITHFINDIRVIFWAYPLTWSLSFITFLIYLLSGRWLKMKEATV